jgi:enoyl-CoA hydratase/carnithine racemase
VVPEAEVLRVAQGLAKKIAMKPAVALAQALKAMTLGPEQSRLDEGMKLESEMFARCAESPDLKEGVMAFIEKRQPKFTDQ